MRFLASLLLTGAVSTMAADLTTQVWMTAPPITSIASVLYSGSVAGVEDDRTTIVMTGHVWGPASDQSSLDSYHDLWFNKQATRFTFSGTTAFEFKSAWQDGMYVNIERCQHDAQDSSVPVHCTHATHYAWLETMCKALADDKDAEPDKLTATTVDDVGSTWTISAFGSKWTAECEEGSDYVFNAGEGIGYTGFQEFQVRITDGAQLLTGSGGTPTPTPTPTLGPSQTQVQTETQTQTSGQTSTQFNVESTTTSTLPQHTGAGTRNKPVGIAVVGVLVGSGLLF